MARLTCWAACQEPAEWHKEAELETRVLRSQQVASPSPHNHPLQARFEKRSENSLQVCSLHLNRLLQRSQISHPWKKAWLVVQLCRGGGGGRHPTHPGLHQQRIPPDSFLSNPSQQGSWHPLPPTLGIIKGTKSDALTCRQTFPTRLSPLCPLVLLEAVAIPMIQRRLGEFHHGGARFIQELWRSP